MSKLLSVLCLVLSGCATTVVNLHSAPDTEIATITGAIDREGQWDWRTYTLISVDGVRIKHGFMADERDTLVKVAPGKHRILVEAAFNTGFRSAGPWHVYVELEAEVAGDRMYRVNGEIREHKYHVWLEGLEDGSKASPEVSAPYTIRHVNTMYVPVFIPVR